MGRRVEIAQLLLQKGLDVNAGTTEAGRQPMGRTDRLNVTAASQRGRLWTGRYGSQLLKAGANVNARDSRSLTPLFFALATEYPSTEMVQTLLQAGADVNARDNTSETPLDWAEKFGNPQVIALLKNSGAKKGVIYQAPKLPSAEPPKPAVALARSLTLLESSSAEFFQEESVRKLPSPAVNCAYSGVWQSWREFR